MSSTFILDGMEHDVGAATCGCNQKCRRCGVLQHWQPIYGGYIELCESCDRDDVAAYVEAYEWAQREKAAGR